MRDVRGRALVSASAGGAGRFVTSAAFDGAPLSRDDMPGANAERR